MTSQQLAVLGMARYLDGYCQRMFDRVSPPPPPSNDEEKSK